MAHHDVLSTPNQQLATPINQKLQQIIQLTHGITSTLKELQGNGIEGYIDKNDNQNTKSLKAIINTFHSACITMNDSISTVANNTNKHLLKAMMSSDDGKRINSTPNGPYNYAIDNIHRKYEIQNTTCSACNQNHHMGDKQNKLQAFHCKHVYHRSCFIQKIVEEYHMGRQPQSEPIYCNGCDDRNIYVTQSQLLEACTVLYSDDDDDNDIPAEQHGESEITQQRTPPPINTSNARQQNKAKPCIEANEEKTAIHATKSHSTIHAKQTAANHGSKPTETELASQQLVRNMIKHDVAEAFRLNNWSVIDAQDINELEFVTRDMVPQYNNLHWDTIIRILTQNRNNRLNTIHHMHTITRRQPPPTNWPYTMEHMQQVHQRYKETRFDLERLTETGTRNGRRDDLKNDEIPQESAYRRYNNTATMTNARWRQLIKIYKTSPEMYNNNNQVQNKPELVLYFLTVLSAPNNKEATHYNEEYQIWKKSAVSYEHCWLYRKGKKIPEEEWNQTRQQYALDYLTHPIAHRNTWKTAYDAYGKRINAIDMMTHGRIYCRLYQFAAANYLPRAIWIEYDTRNPTRWNQQFHNKEILDVPEMIRWRMYGMISYDAFLQRDEYEFSKFRRPGVRLEEDKASYNTRNGVRWLEGKLRHT